MSVFKPSTPRTRAVSCALPLLAIALAAALPARAQDHALFSESRAGTAHYNYNTIQGVVAAEGNSGGTTVPGAAEALSYGSTDEGSGAFHGVQSVRTSADYATAGLHATIVTDDNFSEGRARAQLNDVVTFNVAGADASTVTRIGMDITLDGTISELVNASYLYDIKMFAQGREGLSVGWTTVLFDTLTDPRNYVGWAVSGGTGSPAGFESWELLAGSATDKHLHGVFTLTGAQTAFGLVMGLSLSCGRGTDCDFGNSGHLSFVLPDNVGFTSASGLLLSGTVAPVPEADTYAMMLAGFGLTGWLVRRRRPAGR
jgi:PEP-CTERM motif-containing protein